MGKASLWVAAVLAAAVATPAMGSRLVISEVLYNEVGSSYLGEWIEIYNGTNQVIDLTNYKIGDEETRDPQSGAITEAMFRFPVGASIRPGEVQIIASGAFRFAEVYGFLPTYEVGSPSDPAWEAFGNVPLMQLYTEWSPSGNRLNMSNTNDQAVLLGPDDEIVDAVNWGNTFFLNPGLSPESVPDGRSWERINPRMNTFSATDWQLATNPGSVFWVSNSTPGTVPLPTTPDFVLGDFNFDGGLDGSDVDPFVLALSDLDTYLADFAAAFAELYPGLTLDGSVVDVIGDFNSDGGFDGSDVDGFVEALSGGRPGASVIPEPAALGLMAPAGLLLTRRRR